MWINIKGYRVNFSNVSEWCINVSDIDKSRKSLMIEYNENSSLFIPDVTDKDIMELDRALNTKRIKGLSDESR